MTSLSNPYLAALVIPLTVFFILVSISFNPDWINLVGRVYVFCLLGYVGARYVGRAPVLAWERNTSPEARNIVGWALFIVGSMLNVAYGWIYIAYDRPLWLSSQYWGASFVVLIGVGLTIVATSVPRLPPFGDNRNGLGEVASLLVVITSALSVFIASHIPQVFALLKGIWVGFFVAV